MLQLYLIKYVLFQQMPVGYGRMQKILFKFHSYLPHHPLRTLIGQRSESPNRRKRKFLFGISQTCLRRFSGIALSPIFPPSRHSISMPGAKSTSNAKLWKPVKPTKAPSDFRSTAYPPYPHRRNSFLTVSKRLRDSSSDKGCRKNSMTDGFLFISAKGTKSSSFQPRNSKRGVSIYTILNNLYSRTKILNLFYFSKTLSLSLSISKTGQR